MKIRLNLKTEKWEVSYPQSGSHDGWSEWESLDRLKALRFIELGWTFTYTE